MNSLPQITVILPTYNRREFLPSAIKCIVDQSFKAWRMLVLNDGGEDVGDIVKKFNDPRIEYIDLPHQGKPATVNHALQLVKSKYIAYMDDVDEVFPEHLELLFEAAELNNSAFVYSDTYLTVLDENGNVVSKTIENDTDVTYEDIRFYNRINHKQILHTKELADKVGLYDDRMSILIDYDYIKRLAKLETPYHVHEITGNHYLRGNCYCQISGMWTKSPQKTGESLLAFFEKDPEGLSQVYQNNMHVKIENDTLKSSLADKNAENDSLKSSLADKNAENDSLKSSLADKNAENDSLKVHFNAINSELSAIKASIAFKLGTLLATPWRSCKRVISSNNIDVFKMLKNIKYFIYIKKSGQFNNEWYLSNNPDVAEAFENSFWHRLDLAGIPLISKFGKYMAHPLRHYIQHGCYEHRNPTAFFDGDEYCSKYNDVNAKVINPFYHYLKYGIKEGRTLYSHVANVESCAVVNDVSQRLPNTANIKIKELLNKRFRNLQTIHFFLTNDSKRPAYLNFITDSLGKSLLGGVGTALILASQYAIKNNLVLRIITRHTAADISEYFDFMKMMNEPVPKVVEYWSDYDRREDGEYNYRLEVSPVDEFFTTSWWTTAAVMSMNLKNKIFYIIQEVEPFFYPYGDEHLWCTWQMNSKHICYIVNSHWLWDYFSKNYPNICHNGVYFEPAFPRHLYSPSGIKNKSKRKLFFYAREKNDRNLYHTGLLVLDEAFQRGILKPEEWDVIFAGNSTQCVEFSNGTRASVLGQMSWQDYAKFLKTVDLTFSLMYTPHPSYPPLETIATGGVCVTNSFENKKDNLFCCDNVICGDLTIDCLCNALQKGIQLVSDEKQREQNYKKSTLPDSWARTFEKTIEFMKDFSHV